MIRDDRIWSCIAAFSHDEKKVVSAEWLGLPAEEAFAHIFDIQSGKVAQTLNGLKGNFLCAAFSPDDKFILTGTSDHKAILWNAETSKQRKVYVRTFNT